MTFKNYKSLKIGDWNFKKLIRASDGLVLFEKKPSLPYDRRVSCLRSTGTQYIDTGIVLTGSHEIYLRVYIEQSDSGGTLLYCGTNSPRCWITSGYSRYSENNIGKANNFIRFNAYNEFILNEKKETINGKSQNLPLGKFGTPGTQTAYLFRGNGHSSISKNLRISDWSVKKDGVLIQKLIPVIDLAGRPAMYDEITGQMFYNKGTGEFDWDEIVENQYVTDGLISMWDAEWNCVLGLHSMDTTKWNDIVSGYALQLASGTPTWEAKANVIKGKWGIVSPELQALFKAANKNNLSYEICFSALPYNIKGTVLGFTSTLIGIIANDSTIGDWCWSVRWIPSNKFRTTRNGTLSVVRNGQTGRTDVYEDGALFRGKTGTTGDPTGKTFGIGYGYGQWNNAPTGIKIHCIRLYNRMLTADEIQKNKDIDANRFSI